MDDQNNERYPSNSYNVQKQQIATRSDNGVARTKREARPIASGKEKRRTLAQRFADRFLSFSREELETKIIDEWLFPGIANAIEDFVHFILFQGHGRPRYRRDRDEGRLRRVDYSGSYDDSRRDSYLSRRTRQPELVFDTRDEADEVLQTLYEYLDDYHRVTVKDLYSLADMPTDFAMNSWGWYDLSDATILKCSEGFLLQMPKIQEIRR